MQEQTNKNLFTIALINARSITGKLVSFKQTMDELGADVCLLTESWLKNNVLINTMMDDFTNQTGLCFIRKDRAGQRRGGGIAICYRKDRIQFSKAKIPPSKHEVMAAVGRREGQRRKIVVVTVYIPPWYNAQQNRSLFTYTNDAVLALKNKYENPYIIFGGDFNRRDFKLAVQEHQDIKQIQSGPTRNTASLDIIGSNFNELLIDSNTVDPILNLEGVQSDHRTVFARFRMQRVPSYSIQKYTYLHMTDEGHKRMGEWLKNEDWTAIKRASSTEEAVNILHEKFTKGQEMSYQRKTRTKKSSEPAWMADWIRDIIEDRRTIFRTDGGRSDRWWQVKKKTSRIIKKGRKRITSSSYKSSSKKTTRENCSTM